MYVDNNMPFVEQVRLIALLPRSWCNEDIMQTFGWSRYAIKTAHRMQDDNKCMLKSEKKPQIRQRADPNKIKHFVSTYGLTTLRMDSGEKVELSKQMLQSQKTHAIAEYKKYCEETNFEGLCNRKLFDILTGLKPAQQQIVAGLDDFVVEGIEAWQSLSGTCPGQ
ncbi:unnamed protein product [Rotaria magnacalcarata]|uniref:Uncharacterized protein n=1 Tax=Rotaria magnacalcarata TaxID=392030 RepID=A0A816S549_9BILA|nr:unnamed protein product [Rotaria magnacalcarata]